MAFPGKPVPLLCSIFLDLQDLSVLESVRIPSQDGRENVLEKLGIVDYLISWGKELGPGLLKGRCARKRERKGRKEMEEKKNK